MVMVLEGWVGYRESGHLVFQDVQEAVSLRILPKDKMSYFKFIGMYSIASVYSLLKVLALKSIYLLFDYDN